MAGSTKSSVSVRGGIWKRTLHCETPGRFFRHHGPNAPSGLPFGTKQKTSACSATERAPLPCLAAGSQEKALPKKWLQALHERRGCKKQLNSKTPRFVEAFINMGTTTQTHNENFSIIIVCIKLNLLHPYCQDGLPALAVVCVEVKTTKMSRSFQSTPFIPRRRMRIYLHSTLLHHALSMDQY